MKYLIFLVFCGNTRITGALALDVNAARVRVFLQDSEKAGFSEVTDISARRVKKRFETLIPKEDPDAGWEASQAPEKKKNYEYEQSVLKILKAVKRVVTQGEPLLYPKTVGCGKGVALKCQFTSNKTEDEGFFGYQDKPRTILLGILDSIDKLVNHPILRAYVEMLDYTGEDSDEAVGNDEEIRMRASEFDIKKIKLSKLLMFVKRIVHRDPEEMPQNFVCGIQMDKEKSKCKYYEKGTPETSIVGFRFDAANVNNAVKDVFTSREIMKVFIKVANDVASIFPSLKPGRTGHVSDNARVLDTGGSSTA